MYYHIFILLFYVFFISGNVGSVTLGLSRTFLISVPLIYSLFIAVAYRQIWTGAKRHTIVLVAGAIIFMLFRYIGNAESDLKQDIAILILPALLVTVLPMEAESCIRAFETRRFIKRFLLFFYVVECGMALCEFITHKHIFGWFDPTYRNAIMSFRSNEDFRSVALMGAPLTNALIVTVMMLFYLFTSEYSMKNKIILWAFGLIAVFCFNARMAIAVNLASMLVFIAKGLFQKNVAIIRNIIITSFFICVVISVLYLYGLGERFWNVGNIGSDSSIDIRLRLFKYMMKSNWTDYLWGYSTSQMQHEMATSMKVRVIENFWILYFFRFGIIATSFFSLCYYHIGKQLFSSYSKLDKITVSLFFILLASSNISLGTNYTPLLVFLLCCYVYQPALMKDFSFQDIIRLISVYAKSKKCDEKGVI